MHLVSAHPYKPGNLFTVPVNREDAELIWLIARILDATATDLIYLLYLDRFTEWAECHRCIVSNMRVLYVCVFAKDRQREEGEHRQRLTEISKCTL